jgi:hypothetical protein
MKGMTKDFFRIFMTEREKALSYTSNSKGIIYIYMPVYIPGPTNGLKQIIFTILYLFIAYNNLCVKTNVFHCDLFDNIKRFGHLNFRLSQMFFLK